MAMSPSQRWSSAVQDLFACARGRLPAMFLDRKLTDLGLTGVKPLPNADLKRFEQAIDLVNALVDGRPAPGGQRPEQAMAAAFAEDHPTLGGLRGLAEEYIAFMRPAKKPKAQPAQAQAQVQAERAPDERRPRGGPPPDRRDRRDQRDPRDQRDRHEPRERREAPPAAPRIPRITWDAWLARVFPARIPAPVAVEASAVAETAAETAVAEGAVAVAAAPAAAPATAPAPAAAPVPQVEVFVPPALTAWNLDGDAKRQLARLRERVAAVAAAQAAGQETATALREVVFGLLRPPMPVRDDLRALILEHLQSQGLQLTMAALYPPPPVAALRRDWENLMAARGPADPAVEQAWRKLLDAHPEARAKLEHERAQEFDALFQRFAAAVRGEGEDGPAVRELRGHLESRFAGVGERIEAELAAARAAAEAAAQAGRLVAERNWADPEVIAAIEALDAPARERLLSSRQHELAELERRFRNELKTHGPDGDDTRAALDRLRARFPVEATQAGERAERLRRADDLARQERERREAGRQLSTVHLGAADHRLTRLKPQPRWRLVVAVHGRARGQGHAVGLLLPGATGAAPIDAAWRASSCASLDELDAVMQAVADREIGVIGLPLAACPVRGAAWPDGICGLAALAVLALPIDGPSALSIELPAWAEPGDLAALDAALAGLARRGIAVTRAEAPADAAGALADAVLWTWGGRRDAEVARLRQSGLDVECLVEPSPALAASFTALAGGGLPGRDALAALLAEAADRPAGVAEALAERAAERLASDHEAARELVRHLLGLARGGDVEPARLARELAWAARHGDAALRPRDRLRLAGARFGVQAAAGAVDATVGAQLAALIADLREEWPAEVLEVALAAAGQARAALAGDQAEAVLAPWAKADAIACGGRALALRLAEERVRISAGSGRWKEARKQLDRADELAARLTDPPDRSAAQARLANLRAAVSADDPSLPDDEARQALIRAVGDAEPVRAAGELAVDGGTQRRHAHHSMLRWLVRRRDDVLAGAYLARRDRWCAVRQAPGARIQALRAVVLAPTDADGARAVLADAEAQLGAGAATEERLSLAACAVACSVLGAPPPGLAERLTALRRERPLATPAVDALERALGLAPDADAALAEALPLLAR